MTAQAPLDITRRLVVSGKGPSRKLIVTTPWLGESISGAILYDRGLYLPADLSQGERVTGW